jgi:hypothetical protein
MNSYKIHYLDASQAGDGHRVVPIKFRDKDAALDSACALERSGFRVSKVEGPNFELSGPAFEIYFRGHRFRRRI